VSIFEIKKGLSLPLAGVKREYEEAVAFLVDVVCCESFRRHDGAEESERGQQQWKWRCRRQ
jgi:hypothetical protein